MRQSLELTNSVILERQFQMTVQIKRKRKNGNVIPGRCPSGLKVREKEDTQQRHVKHQCMHGFKRKSFQMDEHKPFSTLHFSIENFIQFKAHKLKKKRRQKPGRVVERSKAPDSKKLLSREFWYTNVCVGSNPFPVRKRFERDEAEPWADKFCHTGTSIQHDSAKQKKTKNRNVVCGW